MILVPEARRAEYLAAGWWGTTTLFDHFAANVAARPGDEAVIDAPNREEFAHGSPRRWTWSQLADQVDRFCILLMEVGVRRDDIVIMQLPNVVEQFVIYLACARLGVIVSPVPVQYRENELRHILERTGAAAAVTFGRIGRAESPHSAAAMFLALRAAYPNLRSVIAFGPDLPAGCVDAAPRLADTLSGADRAALEAAVAAARVSADDVFTICWTSGTEAAPKGVPRSHNEWLVIAPSIIESAELQAGARLLNPFPLVNMAGVSTALATWLVLGGVLVQHHPFTLKVFLQQIRDERIDYTVAPPALLNSLLQDGSLLEGIDFNRLCRIGSGSAPLSDWMVQGFADRYGVQIVNYFGSNEGAALSGSPRDIPDPKLRARFFPRAGVEGYPWSVSTTRKIRTRLVDIETGEDITAPGAPGELRFSGPTIFSGYYNAPELTARAFDEQGYYKTGDLFEIAGERGEFYRFVGRSKDLVIRGGMNISAEEIENLLAGRLGIGEVAVVGAPDRILGERVCVCVAPMPGGTAPSLDEIIAYLRDECRVAAYKLPEYIVQVDALARNPVGKMLKGELREIVRQRFAPEEAAQLTSDLAPGPMPQTEPMAVARAILEAWDVRDFAAVLALFADDGVLHSMMIEPIVGRASIAARLGKLGAAAHNARLRVRHMGVIDGLVFVERIDEITLNGEQSDVPVVGVFQIENGLVKSWREYYDRRQLLGAMGLAQDFDRSAR